jgi:hypothetical protein
MKFKKEDLAGTHYQWNDSTEDMFKGTPTRRNFDYGNGEQMLFMINSYGSTIENFSLETGREIEQLLLYNLPREIKSEISVFNWLVLHLRAAPRS